HEDTRLTLADRVHGPGHGLQVGGQLPALRPRDLAVDLVRDFQGAPIQAPTRRCRARGNTAPLRRVVLAVELQVASVLRRTDERETISFVGADLVHDRDVDRYHGLPRPCEPRPGRGALVRVVDGGR